MICVAVVGSTGQLGTDLVAVLEKAGLYSVVSLNHAHVECGEWASVQKALRKVRPDIVVNCAAFVRVDECEERTAEAFQIKARGT